MLETVKSYIRETPDTPFGEFYQNYICDVQDQNIQIEMKNVKTEDIITLEKLLETLRNR